MLLLCYNVLRRIQKRDHYFCKVCGQHGNCQRAIDRLAPLEFGSQTRRHQSSPCLSAAHIPLYLYPFLNTGSRTKPFEYLRLTSLGVIGALVKVGVGFWL